MTSNEAPVAQKERILALDVLRGFAILGILVMNIQSFSMPGSAYLNPMSYGDMNGVNKWVWILSHVFADQKFMSIFSVLFGAGVMLITESAESKTGKSAGLHYRRTFWLLLIGLAHAHLIWYGDILVAYALCGFWVYLLRKIKPRTQLIMGILLIAVHTVLYMGVGASLKYAPPEAKTDALESWMPSEEQIDQYIAVYIGPFSDQLIARSEEAMFMETFVFLMIFLWRVGGLMLIGMAFYKWGILQAKRSTSFYVRGMAIGLLVGLPIIIIGLVKNYQAGWTMEYSMFIGSQFNYWGSLFIAFAWICLIMLLSKANFMEGLKERLAAVGQMALTNYLTQSIICTIIFYGHGLGYFAQIDRVGQVIVVLGVWALQLIWSPIWLKKYKFGPFEWLWRSLSYWKKQPMMK